MFAQVFAALAIFLALAGSPSPEPPPTPAETTQEKKEVRRDKNENAQPTQTPANESATTVNQLRPSPTEQNSQASSRKDSDESSFNYWNAGAVTILTVALAIFAWLQWRATQKSADAAMLNAQTSRIANRARVVVETLVFRDVGGHTRVYYKVRNIGKTSAYIYERIDTVQMIDNPLPDGPPVLEGGRLNRDYFDLATDRDDVNFGGGMFPKTDLSVANFAAEEAEIYAFGRIKYRDDFGTEGTTEYAWQYRRNGPAFFVQQAGYNRRT